jgi:hypothetical protein
MSDVTRPDLGEPCPVGRPSGRIWHPPVSVEQARARVLHQMDRLEANCRDGIDVGYAIQCLDEAESDYCEIVLRTI